MGVYMHRLSLSSSLRRSGCRGIAGPARPSGPLAPARRPGAAVMSTDAPQELPHKPTLAQRLGQSFNSAGISLFARVALVSVRECKEHGLLAAAWWPASHLP